MADDKRPGWAGALSTLNITADTVAVILDQPASMADHDAVSLIRLLQDWWSINGPADAQPLWVVMPGGSLTGEVAETLRERLDP